MDPFNEYDDVKEYDAVDGTLELILKPYIPAHTEILSAVNTPDESW